MRTCTCILKRFRRFQLLHCLPWFHHLTLLKLSLSSRPFLFTCAGGLLVKLSAHAQLKPTALAYMACLFTCKTTLQSSSQQCMELPLKCVARRPCAMKTTDALHRSLTLWAFSVGIREDLCIAMYGWDRCTWQCCSIEKVIKQSYTLSSTVMFYGEVIVHVSVFRTFYDCAQYSIVVTTLM